MMGTTTECVLKSELKEDLEHTAQSLKVHPVSYSKAHWACRVVSLWKALAHFHALALGAWQSMVVTHLPFLAQLQKLV